MYSQNALTSLSPEEIRSFIVQRLKVALPGLPLESRNGEPNRITLSHPDSGELVLNLGNLVQEVRGASPQAAEQMVDTFVNLAQRAVEPPKIELDKVYPGLRHRAFANSSGHAPSDPLVGGGPGDLVSLVLADQGDCVASLNERAVRSAGHELEDVLAAAEQNFVDLLPCVYGELSYNERVLSLGLHDFPWLGTSLLFVPSLLSTTMAQLGWDRALLASPTRNTVDLVDAASDDAAQIMERWMVERLSGPRTQSEMVFSYERNAADYGLSYRMVGPKLTRLN